MGIIAPATGSTDLRPPGSGPRKRKALSTPQDPPEVVEVETEVVACDGDGGALGHPRVWLNMEGKGVIDCPYCDRQFKLKDGAGGHAGH